jgi:hypothetical protein
MSRTRLLALAALAAGTAAAVGVYTRTRPSAGAGAAGDDRRVVVRDAAPLPLTLYPVRGYRLSAESETVLLSEISRWSRAKAGSEAVFIHALRLRNVARRPGRAPVDPDLYDTLLESVLDDTKYQLWSAGFPLLHETPYGAGYRTRQLTSESSIPGLSAVSGGMTHVDKVLSVLGELGLDLTTPVVAHGGGRFTLADVLEDSLQRWHPARESEWSLLAYCDYLRGQRAWTDSQDTPRSLDDVLRAVLNARKGACYGTHRLYGLAKAVARERAVPGTFDRVLLGEVEQELRTVAARLAEQQHPSGYWAPGWDRPPGPGGVEPKGEDYRTRLIVTGHMLEWFAIAPADLRPPDPAIVRAARYIETELVTDPEPYVSGYYLFPTTHAVRALVHLTEPSPPDQGTRQP